MKRSALLLSALFLFFSMTVWGQKFVFTPQWTAQSQFAGYYAAYENGYYKDAGLDVVIEHPTSSYPTLNRLKNGLCNVITLEVMQAIMANDSGNDLINLMQTSQHCTLLLIARNDEIRHFDDLKGLRVGTWRVGFNELLHMIDYERRLGIEWIEVTNVVNIYISGAIDAILVKSYNEHISLNISGARIGNVISFYDAGFDIPEDGLFVKRDFYERYPEACKAFAEASRKGWMWVREHPEEALAMTMRIARNENVPVNSYHQREMLKEILRVQEDEPGSTPSFVLSREDFDALNDTLLHYGYIKDALDYDRFIGAD